METTVVKALRVIEALASSDGPSALGHVAKVCGVSKSNAHRLLKTLEDCGYVLQDAHTRSYALTLRLAAFGTRVLDQLDVRTVAAPHLRELAEKTDESVHLSVYEQGEVVYVEKVESSQAVRAYIKIGERAPAYCVATGRAMLAFRPRTDLELTLRQVRRFTPSTIVDRELIENELARVRLAGCAVTHGEWKAGVIGVAAPVRSRHGPVVAGVGIAGPEQRMGPEKRQGQIRAVVACAAAISSDLGLEADDGLGKPSGTPARVHGGTRRPNFAHDGRN